MHEAARLEGLSVCVVSLYYAPEQTGIAPYTTALAESLAAVGARVDVVTGVPHFPAWVTDPAYKRGLKWTENIGSVTVRRRRHFVPRAAKIGGRLALEATFAIHTAPTIRRINADILIAVTPSVATVLASVIGRRGRPFGVIVQDLVGRGASESSTASGLISRAVATLEYRALRSASRVGVVAARFAPHLIAEGVVPDRIDHLPNFSHVEPPTMTREEARTRLGWPLDSFLVVHTGNMGMKQGLDSVVTAAQSINAGDHIQFVLVGDGNQRAHIELLSSGLDSAVRLVPPLSSDLYPCALAAADVLLVHERPGVREMSLPSKLTSYVVAARPILARVDVGGITHDFVAQRRMAHIVSSPDPAELLRAVRRLAADDDYRSDLVAAAATVRKEFERASAEERYVRFAESLTKSAPTRVRRE